MPNELIAKIAAHIADFSRGYDCCSNAFYEFTEALANDLQSVDNFDRDEFFKKCGWSGCIEGND